MDINTIKIIKTIMIFLHAVLMLIIACALIYLFVLLVRALKTFIKSKEIKKEQNPIRKTLGNNIKEYRVAKNMTQEFVAERIGVSRQAVSKWESGASDPSTTNLFALAELFEISAEELLKDIER